MHTNDDRSVAALLKFIEWAGQKGQISKGTAVPLKSSCSRVLGVLDDHEQSDVAKVDVDATMRRFANLNPSVGPQSLRDYRGRIEKAISLFLEYRNDPVNWKAPSGRAPKNSSITPEAVRKAPSRPRSRDNDSPANSTPGQVSSVSSGLAYPYPLRADITVMISNLPRDLRLAEADRLSAFLRSLAEDYKPS